MLPALDRDWIQSRFIEHRDLQRAAKRDKSLLGFAVAGILLFGASFAISLFNAREAYEALATAALGGLVVSALALFDQRRRIRDTEDRLNLLEREFKKLGLSVTLHGRMETPHGVCDPLYTEAYDTALPRLKPKED